MLRVNYWLTLVLGLVGGLYISGCGSEVSQPAGPSDPLATGGGVATGSGGAVAGGASAVGGAGASGNYGGSGGVGGVGGAPVPPLAITSVNAPDQFSVVLRFNISPESPSVAESTSYQLDSDFGSLQIQGAEYDPLDHSVRLTTAKQKLGVEYELHIEATNEPMDGLHDSFWSADTASFWAADFGAPNFDQYTLTAKRMAVGEHCVIYVEQGMSVTGVSSMVQTFDSQIYPTATDLFTPAPDTDANGKILLLGLDGGSHYGGYFSATNAYPENTTWPQWGLHSNEMEMVYINVANGGFGYPPVVAHEFQHLLYHEGHGLQYEYWDYHDEGLAECAVLATLGDHPSALLYYVTDPNETFAKGISLVNWEWGDYDHYVMAFMFWTYLASRVDGALSYGDIFDLSGHPQEVEQFITQQLGSDFSTLQLEFLAAKWLRKPTGPYGFNGMLALPGFPPVAPAGQNTLNLQPFAGAFFTNTAPTVDYPGNQGSHIRYAGINSAGVVDLEAPFDAAGGTLIALNTHFSPYSFPPEPSGPGSQGFNGPPSPSPVAKIGQPASRDPAWLNPPVVHPRNYERLRRWRAATRR